MTLAGIEPGEQADEEDAMPIPKLVSGDSSPFSNRSATNPFAGDAPRPYDRQRTSRGTVNTNPYDSDSIGTQFGRYGSPRSFRRTRSTIPSVPGTRSAMTHRPILMDRDKGVRGGEESSRVLILHGRCWITGDKRRFTNDGCECDELERRGQNQVPVSV
jgi:hypothetical protein